MQAAFNSTCFGELGSDREEIGSYSHWAETGAQTPPWAELWTRGRGRCFSCLPLAEIALKAACLRIRGLMVLFPQCLVCPGHRSLGAIS